MTTNDLLLDAFGRVEEEVHAVLQGLDEKALTYRPSKDANSIAWLVWHLARIQDDHVADVAGHEQIWTAEGWNKKFNLPFSDDATGWAHTSKDVAQVQSSAELLRGYYDAVHAKTVVYMKGLKDSDYKRIVDKRWNPPVTLSVRLVSVISDDLQHVGQAAYIRGLLQ